MCPIYEWFGHDNDITVQVIRSVKDIEVYPTYEEAGNVDETNWERKLCSSAKFIRGDSWNYRKGGTN